MSLSTAFEFACRYHDGQSKKGTSIPFIYHPLAVASIVLSQGGTSSQAMAALLHDTIADGKVTRDEIESRFGAETAELVFAFADPDPIPGREWGWRETREAYIEKLSHFDARVLLITASEELHDGSELWHDLKHYGWRSWEKYPVLPTDVVWYYDSLLRLFEAKLSSTYPALLAEFREMIEGLRILAA